MESSATQTVGTALRLTLSRTQPAMRAWALGQILQATVLRSEGQRALLEIAGVRVQARTSTPLDTGERLRLSVSSLEPRVVLQRMPTRPETPLPGLQKETLRESLPRQLPLTESIASLRSLASATLAGGTGESALPRPLQKLIGQLLDALPTPDKLTEPKQLEKAIRDSGLFLEARLAQAVDNGASPGVARDLKAALLRLLSALPQDGGQKGPPSDRVQYPGSDVPPPAGERASQEMPPKEDPRGPMLERHLPRPQPRQPPPPPLEFRHGTSALQETARQVEGALARVEVHQAASVNTSQNPAHALWLVELPVRDPAGDYALQIRIERDGKAQGEEAGPAWSLTFALDLGQYGPLYARVTLRGEALTTTLWAEQERTRDLFQERLSLLRQQLEQAGFSEPLLQCHCGRPPLPAAAPGEPLLDARA